MAFVEHSYDTKFVDWLSQGNIEPNKLYTLCNEPVYWRDLEDEVRNYNPRYAAMLPVTIIEKAIMDFYMGKEAVRFSTVLRKSAHDFGLSGLFDKDALQKIAEIFGATKQRKQLFFEAYAGKIDWDRGDFGNANSCYWSERPMAKDMLDMVFTAGEGGAFRIYSAVGRGPEHPDNPKVRGYGRLWAIVYLHGLMTFNPYPGHNLFGTYVGGLEKALGCASNRGHLVNYNDDDNILYINKDEGAYLSRVLHDHVLSFHNYTLEVPEVELCSQCHQGGADLFRCRRRGRVCDTCCLQCFVDHDNYCMGEYNRELHQDHVLQEN